MNSLVTTLGEEKERFMKKIAIVILTGLTGLGCLFSLTGCTKELVYGKDHESPPISQNFRQGSQEIFAASKITLQNLGYKIDFEDEEKGYIKTGWTPTEADSHYLELFDRQDYGTFSAYYQLEVRIKPSDAETEVEVAAPSRCIVRHIKSSFRAEKKFLSKLKNQLRGSDLQMSNVGVKDQ